jgi:hypothetical protein
MDKILTNEMIFNIEGEWSPQTLKDILDELERDQIPNDAAISIKNGQVKATWITRA